MHILKCASHKKYGNMKVKIVFIVALLCFINLGYVFCAPESDKYKVVNKEANKIEIEVYGNCDIIVADIAPNGKKIYGDKVGTEAYGGTNGEYFQKAQVNPNSKIKGITITKDKGRVILRIEHSKLADTQIQIVSAKDSVIGGKTEYFPGSSFIVLLKKGDIEEKSNAAISGTSTSLLDDQTVHNTFEIKDVKSTLETLVQDVDSLKKNGGGSEKGMLDILLIIFALLVGLLIGYFLFRQNRKELKELAKDYALLKRTVANLEATNKKQAILQQAELQKDKGKSTMSDAEIKKFIVEQITIMRAQSALHNQTPLTSNPAHSQASTPAPKEEKVLDTDNVKYHQGDNSFSLEQTDIKIFRIYSKKGEYYYTIVDDSAVREELKGMLQAFEGCIIYQTTGGEAKRIEPVTDGKVIKDGNNFYVDVNNKLVVKFV